MLSLSLYIQGVDPGFLNGRVPQSCDPLPRLLAVKKDCFLQYVTLNNYFYLRLAIILCKHNTKPQSHPHEGVAGSSPGCRQDNTTALHPRIAVRTCMDTLNPSMYVSLWRV